MSFAAALSRYPRRALSLTAMRANSHFDTHRFVERLETEGLTRTQAEGVMTVLAEVVDESIKGMEVALVSKAESEKVSDFIASVLTSSNAIRRK